VSSNINYLSINENYPVAGVDNDTQTLRDNFDTIKTSLRVANEEVTDLQDNVARTDVDSDFGLNIVSNAVLQNVRQKVQGGDTSLVVANTTVDFLNGSYQIFKFGASVVMEFLNFPGDPELTADPDDLLSMGKMTLELTGSNVTEFTVSFNRLEGSSFKTLGFPNYPFEDENIPTITLTSATNPVIIEVWRHNEETIFMHYIGQFL
jgi:hypothetical protein